MLEVRISCVVCKSDAQKTSEIDSRARYPKVFSCAERGPRSAFMKARQEKSMASCLRVRMQKMTEVAKAPHVFDSELKSASVVSKSVQRFSL